MENAQSDSRFDWIGWLATIPGVPFDWGLSAPRTEPEAVRVAVCPEPPLPLAA